jgi:hypothetical protein
MDHTVHIADKKPKLQLCCPVDGCLYKNESETRLRTHLRNKHKDGLPSKGKPMRRSDQQYTDPKQAADYLANSQFVRHHQKVPALDEDPSAITTPGLGSSPHLNHTPSGTRSASMSGSALPLYTGTNSSLNAAAQAQVDMCSWLAVPNFPFGHPSDWLQLSQESFTGARSDTSPFGPPLDPNHRLNPETMHNGYSANHEHPQQMMPHNHQAASAYQRPMPNYTHHESMENTLATPNMNLTANLPSQHAS